MNARLTFKFSIGHYNGTMSMKIMSGGKQLLSIDQFEKNTFEFTTDINWPDAVEFIVSNKGPLDTEVGASGEILQDKFIKLESLIVDRMSVHILALLDCVELETKDQILKTNYWGFNGCARLKFDRDDTLSWHLNNAIKVTAQDNSQHSVMTQHYDDAGLGTIY